MKQGFNTAGPAARLLAGVAAISLIGVTGADAQTPAAGAGQEVETVPVGPQAATATPGSEVIVVTGTAIRGVVAPVGSAAVNLDRDTLVEAPARDAGALIASLTQGSSLGTTLQGNTGRNAGVNLRGLGNNATLLLFDGHRTVQQGVTSQISDPNVIPFAAIERVEVVTDGASAIYGSDAVAGVVNYILRKDFDGAEFSARYKDGLYSQYTVEGVIGTTWDSGSVMLGLAYEYNDEVMRSARDYLAQDLRPFGGNDNRFVGTTVQPGATPALIIGNTVYGLPDGLNGRVPTAAEVLARQGQPTLFDNSALTTFYSERQRESGVFKLNQSLGRAGELTWTTLFNIRENWANSGGDGAFMANSITVRPGSPYYITGLGSGNQNVVYNFRLNNPDRVLQQKNYESTINNTLEYVVDLVGDFQFTGLGTYGRNYGCAVCQPQFNSVNGAQITQPANAGLFNPYQTGPQAGAEGLFGGFTQEAVNELLDISGKIDGAVMSLPAGDLRIAVGAEYQKLDFWLQAQNSLNTTNTYQVSRLAQSDRTIESAFGEVYIPVFSSDNAIPGFQSLDLSAAIRYDSYSDAGDTTNPKFGVSWKPVDDILIRGSWGTSFRAATLGESDPRTIGQTNRQFIANGLNNPAIPVTNTATGQSLVLSRTGNTAGLKPESAKVWSLGVDYDSSHLEGLTLGVTYYSVDYEDRIENLPNQTLILSNPATFDLYRDFFIIAPQPSTCVNGAQPGLPNTPAYSTYNPLYLPWLNSPDAVYSPTTANDCQLVGIIAGGRLNLGRVQQSGLDMRANYEFETPVGEVNLGASFTKILELKRSLLPNSPLFDALDTIGNPISERGRLSARLRNGGLTGNLFVNYTGGYLNNATITVNGSKIPDTQIPEWITADASIAYEIEGAGAMNGVRFGLNVENLTDEEPPIVLSGTNAVDTGVHSVFGRMWTLEVSKRF